MTREKRQKKTKSQEQSEKFIEKARVLGVDEDEAAFDQKLKTVAGKKPKSEKNEAPDK